ncbi:peptidase inhibitor family I36 protein [Actinosynnema sp. NPDC047251]|uniref:Putative secreted protein n=1 Tax=Saccharothrix espanaensis (strain ATCC 51144 / DSM 44229 / JCM 9112 / NBRC 15066 / NRRL 15764) TaxID=1179773 RepID=K0K042_SACES|nr:peptidase inhibitor family I36 protein [Saccharothrix espanaensis]CCH30279.1 putative secreted protein [Saccharothrix espanaensis DSM 44229]
MIRKLSAVLGVVASSALVFAGPAAATAPDYAAPADGAISITAFNDCPSARMCIFNNLNGGTPYGSFATGDGDLADSNGPRGLNNNAESVSNRTNQLWCFYDAGGFNNEIFRVASGFEGNLDPEDRNRVTSLRVCP